MLIECSHVPICCGCYVFLFGFRNRRAPSPCQRTVPSPGRFSIVVCVSRVLFSSSGGALVARFGGIWSLEMEGACRVCPRAYLLRLLRVSVHVSQSSRTQPMPTSSPQSWSVFDRRFGFGVSGALLFFWWGACGAFWGNLVVGDGRCLSCVPARACLLWLLRVAVFRNCRVICPCQ